MDYIHEYMTGWVEMIGWMDQMDVNMYAWLGGCMNGLNDRMDGLDGWLHECTAGWVGGWSK